MKHQPVSGNSLFPINTYAPGDCRVSQGSLAIDPEDSARPIATLKRSDLDGPKALLGVADNTSPRFGFSNLDTGIKP